MPTNRDRGRPTTERGRAAASKERALALLRWHQLRVLRREYKSVSAFEATLARMLSMIRDRMLALPDRVPDLSTAQRQALRREIAETLEACSRAELIS
jgi:hypothetical protein